MNLKEVLELLFGSGIVIVIIGAISKLWADTRNQKERHRKAHVAFERARDLYKRALHIKRISSSLIIPGQNSTEIDSSEDPNDLLQQADNLLYKALEIGPERYTKAEIRLLQAEMLLENRQYEECIARATESLRLNRRLMRACEHRAEAYLALEYKHQALLDYKKVYKKNPYDSKIQDLIGDLKEDLGYASLTIWEKFRHFTHREKRPWKMLILA